MDTQFHKSPVWHEQDIVSIDSVTGEYLLKKKIPPIPYEELEILTFEAANAARSALDHAVFSASGPFNSEKDELGVKFPMGKTPSGLDVDIKKNCFAVPKRIIEVIRTFEPFPKSPDYQGGNEYLSAIRILSNIKKHRTFVPSAVSIKAVIGGALVETGVKFAPKAVSEWDEKRNEITCFRVPPSDVAGFVTSFQMINYCLGVSRPDLPVGIPVHQIISKINDEVTRVVDAIELADAKVSV